jgi:hypothetical protein
MYGNITKGTRIIFYTHFLKDKREIQSCQDRMALFSVTRSSIISCIET